MKMSFFEIPWFSMHVSQIPGFPGVGPLSKIVTISVLDTWSPQILAKQTIKSLIDVRGDKVSTGRVYDHLIGGGMDYT